MKNKIIKTMPDSVYQNTHSQVSKYIRKKCKWTDVVWGKDNKNNLYFSGQISGFCFPNVWVKIDDVELPFTSKDIIRLAEFLQVK